MKVALSVSAILGMLAVLLYPREESSIPVLEPEPDPAPIQLPQETILPVIGGIGVPPAREPEPEPEPEDEPISTEEWRREGQETLAFINGLSDAQKDNIIQLSGQTTPDLQWIIARLEKEYGAIGPDHVGELAAITNEAETLGAEAAIEYATWIQEASAVRRAAPDGRERHAVYHTQHSRKDGEEGTVQWDMHEDPEAFARYIRLRKVQADFILELEDFYSVHGDKKQ